MEPTMQNSPNTAKNTVWITIGAIIIIVLLVWGGVYMYNNRIETGENIISTSTTGFSSSTRTNLGEDDRVVTADERAMVTTYLSNNINQLSPKKARAGSTLTVNTVIIEAAGRAIVEYGDGTTSHTAAVSYALNSNGVVVNSFEILEK